ncbi:hypothetical protein [Streptomyces sp. NPDC055299]
MADHDRRCFPAGPAVEIFLDIPGPRDAARALVTARGPTPRSHTVRRDNGPVPPADQERTVAVTSLELG